MLRVVYKHGCAIDRTFESALKLEFILGMTRSKTKTAALGSMSPTCFWNCSSGSKRGLWFWGFVTAPQFALVVLSMKFPFHTCPWPNEKQTGHQNIHFLSALDTSGNPCSKLEFLVISKRCFWPLSTDYKIGIRSICAYSYDCLNHSIGTTNYLGSCVLKLIYGTVPSKA